MKTLILLLLLTTSIFAQPTPSPTISPITIQNTETKEATEVSILRAQLDTMREYNDRLINTVYWSLGTLVGMAVLLVGFSWFTNYRIYERDKAALSQELSNSIDSQIRQIRNTLETDFAAKLEEVSTKSVDAAKSISESYVKSLNSRVDMIENKLLRLQYESISAKARYWELKGTKMNEMDRYREMLAVAIKMDGDHEITSSLQGLIRMFKAGAFPFWADVPGLTTMLDSLPAKFSTEVETIKNLLRVKNEQTP